MEIYKNPKRKIGYIGELNVMLELTKRGIFCSKLDPLHDYDILTEGDIKIEVKSGRLCILKNGSGYTSEGWQFGNHKTYLESNEGILKSKREKRDRRCDFFVCVCFGSLEDDFTPLAYYIIPKEDFGGNQTMFIRRTFRDSKWEGYCNNWDLITSIEREVLPDNDIVVEKDKYEIKTLDKFQGEKITQ